MQDNQVHQRVREALGRVETERNVRVLYACESGSRAWGFASRDSDYDVRFLYVHPRDWYLAVEERRDVIEPPITEDLDVNGWERRVRDAGVYARGSVRHPDHATIALHEWHRVWMNTENKTRQTANVAFLD
jgi:hypothetical protein